MFKERVHKVFDDDDDTTLPVIKPRERINTTKKDKKKNLKKGKKTDSKNTKTPNSKPNNNNNKNDNNNNKKNDNNNNNDQEKKGMKRKGAPTAAATPSDSIGDIFQGNYDKNKKAKPFSVPSTSIVNANGSITPNNPELNKKELDEKCFKEFLCYHCGQGGHNKNRCPQKNPIIYIGNCPMTVDDEQLIDFLKPVGHPVKIVWARDKQTNVFKGHGYITMSSWDEAQNAINMTDKTLGGRTVLIQFPNSPQTGICLNCGLPGHMRKDCKVESKETCFVCKMTGHTRANCPNKAAQIECFRCGGFGHRSFDCPQAPPKDNNTNNTDRNTTPNKDFLNNNFNNNYNKAIPNETTQATNIAPSSTSNTNDNTNDNNNNIDNNNVNVNNDQTDQDGKPKKKRKSRAFY